MKKVKIIFTVIVANLSVLFSQGVLNVDSAQIILAPLDSLENSGTGTFTFDIYESGFVDVPIAGSPATVTITLSNLDLIDTGNNGANSVSGYEPYFDIYYLPDVGGNAQIVLYQVVLIPGSTELNISVNVTVTANTTTDNPNNGGNVNLTPGTGQSNGGMGYTGIFIGVNK